MAVIFYVVTIQIICILKLNSKLLFSSLNVASFLTPGFLDFT